MVTFTADQITPLSQMTPQAGEIYYISGEMARNICKKVEKLDKSFKSEREDVPGDKPFKTNEAMRKLGIVARDVRNVDKNGGFFVKLDAYHVEKLKDQGFKPVQMTHITGVQAGLLYQAVNALGKGNELKGLDNIDKPTKFCKALEILGISVKSIANRSDLSGYNAQFDSKNLQKFQEIINKQSSLQNQSPNQDANQKSTFQWKK
jgi:hypothetical protein